MHGREAFHLENIDSVEFESICKLILEKLGYGSVKNIKDVADGGRDLEITSAKGIIIVECKHQPRSRIGRPIVQKLHSAVVTSKAVKGMLMTTGHFTAAAVEFAQGLRETGTSIELVDLHVLLDMAKRAGVDLISRHPSSESQTYDIVQQEVATKRLLQYLRKSLVSRPALAPDAIKLENFHIDLVPAYAIRYNVDAVFKTSAGLIHHESAKDRLMFLDANSGDAFVDAVEDFYSSLTPKAFDPRVVRTWTPGQSVFGLELTSARKKAREFIRIRHTNNIRYVGRNNQSYVKNCQPKDRDVVISYVQPTYLPFYSASLQLIDAKYPLKFLVNGVANFKLLNKSLSTCRVCSKEVSDQPWLCTVCGLIVHRQKSFRHSHGFSCKDCQTTICRNCARYVSRFLILKRVLCPKCAESDRYDAELIKTPPELLFA